MAENANHTHSPDIPKRDIQNSHGGELKTKLPTAIFDTIEKHANQTNGRKPFEPIPVPPEYNHRLGSFAYKSPIADTTLDAIRDRLAEHPGTKPNIYDLLKIVQDESSDIKNQQEEYEHKYPESKVQKKIVQAAYRFLNRPENKGKDEAVVSMGLDQNGAEVFIPVEMDSLETFVIKREAIAGAYLESHSLDKALDENLLTEEAILDTSIGNFPKSAPRTRMQNYLTRQKQHWAYREMRAKTDEDRKAARQNVDIFNSFIDDLEDRLKPGEEIEKEVGTIDAYEIIKEHAEAKIQAVKEAEDVLKEAIPKDVLGEAEKIAAQSRDRILSQKKPRRFFYKKK